MPFGSDFELAGSPKLRFRKRGILSCSPPFHFSIFTLRTDSGRPAVPSPLKNWSLGQYDFAPPCAMLKSGGLSDDERAKTCGRSTSFRRRTVSRQGEEKADRNTCQFRNLPNSIKTQDITFSNRNTKHLSATRIFHTSPVACHVSRSANHKSRITSLPTLQYLDAHQAHRHGLGRHAPRQPR